MKTLICVCLLFFGGGARAADAPPATPEADKLTVGFGGYVDTYYAYDFNDPQLHDRPYSTQAERSNEFNVNLAYVEARVSGSRVRGRLALQAGTSVQANYAGEATQGTVSGPTLAEHIQEAFAGYQVTDRLWIDAGIFLSHIGLEDFISKDNWTYTRSFMADFSPYYETGVRATYQVSDQVAAQLLGLNGWGNISENNGAKSVGMQLAWTPSSRLSLTYNNLLGDEAGSRLRFFNDAFVKYELGGGFAAAAAYDVGWQQSISHSVMQIWQGFSVQLRYQPSARVALCLRGEGYFDPNQVIVQTATPNGFQATGTSLNVDLSLHKNLLWRNEVHGSFSKDRIFPSNTSGMVANEIVAVSSLAMWF